MSIYTSDREGSADYYTKPESNKRFASKQSVIKVTNSKLDNSGPTTFTGDLTVNGTLTSNIHNVLVTSTTSDQIVEYATGNDVANANCGIMGKYHDGVNVRYPALIFNPQSRYTYIIDPSTGLKADPTTAAAILAVHASDIYVKSTYAANVTITPPANITAASNVNGVALRVGGSSYTITDTGVGDADTTADVSNFVMTSFGAATINASDPLGREYDTLSTLYIHGAPVTGTGVTCVNNYSLFVGSGSSRFNGHIVQQGAYGLTTGTSTVNLNGFTTVAANRTLTLAAFTTPGVLHNNSSGTVTSSLIVDADITNATISNSKLATPVSTTATNNSIVMRDASGNTTINGIRLLSTDSTNPSTLDYCEWNTHNTTFTFNGTGGGTTGIVSIQIRKLGLLLMMALDQSISVGALATTGTSSTALVSNTALPPRFCPSSPHVTLCTIQEDSIILPTPGIIRVSNTGIISIYKSINATSTFLDSKPWSGMGHNMTVSFTT